jgi:thiamine-phosphate pyrophosphorylase
MRLVMPRLYVILDAGLIRGQVHEIAAQLIATGVRILQYRGKNVPARKMLMSSRQLAELARKAGASFFVNDRPDLSYLAGADGVHVGQDDLSVDQARAIVGQDRWVGVSTHNQKQFERAVASSADYVAIGPIFATASKANPDPVVGTELLRRLRPLTDKPIVAIGGMRLESVPEVMEAGANCVAVISDILAAADPAARAKQYLQRLEAMKPTAKHGGSDEWQSPPTSTPLP